MAVILPMTFLLAPVQALLLAFAPQPARRLPRFWHRLFLKLIGVRVHVHGQIATERPLMLVSNHVSWSDILVLGSIADVCFIAKDEVRSWPGINWLARLQRTVFVNRERKRDAGIQADTIAERLVEGDVMVLFAEGTTGNGQKLLPFKSALFGAAQSAIAQAGLERVAIQPVAIAYNGLHGMPLGRFHQALAAWPGDLELVPHLSRFLTEGAFDVDVGFGDAISFTAATRRREIADATHANVRNMFARLRRLYHR